MAEMFFRREREREREGGEREREHECEISVPQCFILQLFELGVGQLKREALYYTTRPHRNLYPKSPMPYSDYKVLKPETPPPLNLKRSRPKPKFFVTPSTLDPLPKSM